RIKVRGRIEVTHLRGDFHAHVLGFESRERRDRTSTLAHARPDRARIVAQRANRTDAGDDDTTIHGETITRRVASRQVEAAGSRLFRPAPSPIRCRSWDRGRASGS